MDPVIFLDALMEALTSREPAQAKAALAALETLIDFLFELISQDTNQVPFFNELASRLCHVCYKVLLMQQRR